MPDALQIPVTMLTAYLGGGKTALLNRVLSEEHGLQQAGVRARKPNAHLSALRGSRTHIEAQDTHIVAADTELTRRLGFTLAQGTVELDRVCVACRT